MDNAGGLSLFSDLVQFGFQRKDANPAVDFHFKHRKSMFFFVAPNVYLAFSMPFHTVSLLGTSLVSSLNLILIDCMTYVIWYYVSVCVTFVTGPVKQSFFNGLCDICIFL